MISNLTNREHFRLYGTLTPERIETLLDDTEQLASIRSVDASVQEARAQFPDEDFLEGIKGRLYELSKRLRGENRETLIGIVEAVDDIQQCQFYATEYAFSELAKLEKVLQEN